MTGFIDAGLPATRADWPEGVLDQLPSFPQGTVIQSPTFVYFGDPKTPVHAISRSYSMAGYDTPMPMLVAGPFAPRWAIITSGTCDVGEEGASRLPIRPAVQVSPVVDMDDEDSSRKKQIRDGKIAHLVHIPVLSAREPGFWVADLRFEFPVEKGWLASQAPISGFENETEQLKIGLAVAHLRSRPAMADKYYGLVHSPLGDQLSSLYKANRSLADAVDAEIVEWGVRIDSRLNPSRVEVVLLSETSDASSGAVAWWRTAVDAVRPAAAAAGLAVLGPRFARLDTISVLEYRNLTIMPSPSRKFSPV